MADSELVYEINTKFKRKQEYFEPDRNRFLENARIYWGVDYGQYPYNVVQELLDQQRQAPTFNLMTQKMDGLRGQLLRNQFDVKYVPMRGDIDELTLALQDMYYSDKDDMNWDYSYDWFLRDFLIQNGWERMFVSTENTVLGNLAFTTENPINIFPDPGWVSMFPKDLRELDKAGFYHPEELKEIYPDKAHILEELRKFEFAGALRPFGDYGYHQIGIPYKELEARWGSKHLVIENHRMIYEIREWEYDTRTMTPFPETGYKPGSPEDIEFKKAYVEQNQIPSDRIKLIEEPNRRYHITTIVPSLSMDLVLEDRDSEIQIGRLPFFPLGPARFGSQYRGLADLMRDLQLNINKYIMMMEEILNKSARGGYFLDPDIVGNDDTKKKEVERDWNNPAARIWTEAGKSQGGLDRFMKEFPSHSVPSDLFSFHQLMHEYADKLSYQTPAAEGRTESAKESGKLFQSKFEASVITRGIIDRMLEMHWHDKAEAYMDQAKITYAGIPREFSRRDGKGKVTINQEVNEEGRTLTLRDISRLQKHRIVLTPSKKGIDVRTNQRGLFAELKQTTQDPLIQYDYDGQIVSTFEMNDAQRAEIEEDIELAKTEARLAKMLSIRQMQQAMGGPQQQQQPPAPQVTEGTPARGQLAQGTPPRVEGQLRTIERGITGQ